MHWPDGPYTRHPRATMWLVRPGEFTPLGSGGVVDVEAFYVSKAPITNLQYEVFCPDRVRSVVSGGDDDPAVEVSWVEAAAYCAWYAEWTGKPFRLLTSLEWEYGARGEGDDPCWVKQDPKAAEACIWHRDNSDGVLHPVESRRANVMGLYDLVGSVWEWTATAGEAQERIMRGGSFRFPLADLGCEMAQVRPEAWRADDCGFRIARSL